MNRNNRDSKIWFKWRQQLAGNPIGNIIDQITPLYPVSEQIFAFVIVFDMGTDLFKYKKIPLLQIQKVILFFYHYYPIKFQGRSQEILIRGPIFFIFRALTRSKNNNISTNSNGRSWLQGKNQEVKTNNSITYKPRYKMKINAFWF